MWEVLVFAGFWPVQVPCRAPLARSAAVSCAETPSHSHRPGDMSGVLVVARQNTEGGKKGHIVIYNIKIVHKKEEKNHYKKLSCC